MKWQDMNQQENLDIRRIFQIQKTIEDLKAIRKHRLATTGPIVTRKTIEYVIPRIILQKHDYCVKDIVSDPTVCHSLKLFD